MAVPAAVVVIGTRAISLDHAWAEANRLGTVLAFLAAVLILARLSADGGLFQACGSWMSFAARGRPRRLLAAVFAAAAVVTAVMLTPVVFAIAARPGVRSRPHVRTTSWHGRLNASSRRFIPEGCHSSAQLWPQYVGLSHHHYKFEVRWKSVVRFGSAA